MSTSKKTPTSKEPKSLEPSRDFGGVQSQGGRPYQEDSFGFSSFDNGDGATEGLLMVLADGMGGYVGGKRASATAVETFIDVLRHTRKSPSNHRLGTALHAANRAIAEAIALAPRKFASMGTTLVAAAIVGRSIEWISVGDSPLYLWRKGKLRRLNEDHSLAPYLKRQVKQGGMSESEALAHPEKNMLLSALTGEKLQLIDWPEDALKLSGGDVIVMASDGLNTLSDESIATILQKSAKEDAETVARNLVAAVLAAGKYRQDNVTVLAVRVPRQGAGCRGRI